MVLFQSYKGWLRNLWFFSETVTVSVTVYCHKYCRKLLFVWKQKQAKELSWRFCLQNEKAHNALVNFPLTSLILRDPPCKYGNIRFTTELFIALSEHVSIRYTCFKFWKLFHLWTLCLSSLQEKKWINHFQSQKNYIIFHIFD